MVDLHEKCRTLGETCVVDHVAEGLSYLSTVTHRMKQNGGRVWQR